MDLVEMLFNNAMNAESGGGGDSDFTTATLETVNGGRTVLPIPIIVHDSEMDGSCGSNMLTPNPYTVILYKGKAYLPISPQMVESVSGDITYDENSHLYVMTGDCTITFRKQSK